MEKNILGIVISTYFFIGFLFGIIESSILLNNYLKRMQSGKNVNKPRALPHIILELFKWVCIWPIYSFKKLRGRKYEK